MAEGYQMTYRFIDADGVVENDIAHPFTDRPEVVEDDTGFLMPEFLDQRTVEFRDHQYYACDLHLQKAPDIFDRPLGLVIRIQQYKVVTGREHSGLNAFDDLGEER